MSWDTAPAFKSDCSHLGGQTQRPQEMNRKKEAKKGLMWALSYSKDAFKSSDRKFDLRLRTQKQTG